MNDHHEHQVIAKLNTAGDQLISGIIYIKLIMTRRAKKKGQMPRSLILKTRFTFYKGQKLLESVPSKVFDKKCVNSKIKLDHVISRFFMIEGLVRVNLNPEAVESEVVELLLVALDSEFVVPYKFGLHAIHDPLLGPYGAENVFYIFSFR